MKTLDETRLLQFKKKLSNCVNVKSKVFYNKELILSYSPIKKKIGFITKGKANIVKTDKEGNTTIMRDLKENDIFSNLFFQETEDEIYIISNEETEVIFIDYYNIIKNCNQNCPFHNSIVLTLFDLFKDYRPLFFFAILAFIFFIFGLLIGIPVLYEFFLYHFINKIPSAVLASSLMIVAILFVVLGLILDHSANEEKRNHEIMVNNWIYNEKKKEEQ